MDKDYTSEEAYGKYIELPREERSRVTKILYMKYKTDFFSHMHKKRKEWLASKNERF